MGSAGLMAPPADAPELVVFDLGGTAIHDRGEVPAAFTAALQASGIDFDPHEIISWRGASRLQSGGRSQTAFADAQRRST